MRRPPLSLLAALALAGAVGACGKAAPVQSLLKGASSSSVAAPGAVALATKNTTRLGGGDAASDAAAVARAVYPGLTAATRPQAVVLVDQGDWPAALAASALASAPLGAPLLYADGASLPAASAQALRQLRPLGAARVAGAQVIRIGTTAVAPGGYRAFRLARTPDPARTAAAVARLLTTAQGKAPRQVLVLAQDAPRALQMPAAGLAAVTGAPILFIGKSAVPAATSAALRRLHRPAIYLLGATAVSEPTLAALARLGRVKRVAGGAGPGTREAQDPAQNAVAVSRFSDGSFGWGIHEAGHGLVFANSTRPLDAPAAAPLSSHGDYGPLLLVARSNSLPPALTRYLSDIEPGYTPAVSPVRAVYNHGWLIGDEDAISARVQAEIDAILEVAPRTPSPGEPSLPTPE